MGSATATGDGALARSPEASCYERATLVNPISPANPAGSGEIWAVHLSDERVRLLGDSDREERVVLVSTRFPRVGGWVGGGGL